MEFYFIRHAQSQNNLLWDMTGSSNGRSDDPELSEVGYRQARHLAQFLSRTNSSVAPPRRGYYNHAGFGLTHLYASLMVRAVQTGSIVADALDLPLVGLEDLCECGGIYLEENESGTRVGKPGKSRAYFEQHFPRLVVPEICTEQGWWNRPFETHEQMVQRATRFWRDVLGRHGKTSDRVAVFSHGEFYNYLLRLVLGMDVSNLWFDLNNVGITRIDLSDDYVHIAYANRVDFLPDELIT